MASSVSENTPKTISIDRSVHQIIPNELLTRKRNNGSKQLNSFEIEFLHRIQGTSVLFQTTKLLRLSPSVFATSTAIFHRFYHRDNCTLEKYDVWSVSIASVLLACKVEEEVRRIREIILVFLHVYRRMRLGLEEAGGDESCDNDASSEHRLIMTAQSDICNEKGKTLNLEEKRNILRYVRPLPEYGILYKEWQEQVMEMENFILRELGFTLYWIPESHPHSFLLYFIKVLDVKEKKVAQVAWNYCNDSCRLDLCVRFAPEMMACAAIHLASFRAGNDDFTNEAKSMSLSLPMSPRPWWHAFIGSDKDEDLSIICNAILALGDPNCVRAYADATNKYVISLIDGGSFCDPGSFIWNAMD